MGTLRVPRPPAVEGLKVAIKAARVELLHRSQRGNRSRDIPRRCDYAGTGRPTLGARLWARSICVTSVRTNGEAAILARTEVKEITS